MAGKDAPLIGGDGRSKVDFHVAGDTLNSSKMTRPCGCGIDQRRGDAYVSEPPSSHIAKRAAEESGAGPLECVGVNPRREPAGGRRNSVVSTGQRRVDRIEPARRHRACVRRGRLAFSKNHFRNLDVALGRFVKRRAV